MLNPTTGHTEFMSSRRALQNVDILDEIFQHLSLIPDTVTQSDIHALYSDDAEGKQRTLASAALVCKSFSEPASRVLWSVLPHGIQPLLRGFSNLRENVDTQCAPLQRLHDIAHETTLAEWEVFERLAARVRCLILDVRPSEAPSTLSLLKARWEARQIPLFPNLSVVDWPDSLNDSHRELLQVLCANQTLTSFLIKRGFKYATTVSSADLAVVAHSNPKLSHLHIRADWHPSWCAQLTTFRHLRSIYMYDVDATFYRHLSTLQSLEVLSAYVQKTEHPSSSGMASKTYQGFPSLRRLEMPSATTVPPSTLLSMVTPIASPILTSLVLGVEAASASDVYTCLDSLCRLDVLRSLRKLHLVVESTEDRTPAPAAYAFADMSGALFKLRDLEDVEIRASTGTVSFTDADASQMPAAWPRLTSLSITSFSLVPEAQRTQPPESRPSLSALVALAQALPAVKTLDVEVAGVSDHELARLERRVGSRPPQTALRQVTFANSGYRQDLKLCDVERLAQVLHRMFPNVGDLGERYGVNGTTRYVYWGREAMDTDAFQLVARLEALTASRVTASISMT